MMRGLLRDLLDAAIGAADAARCLPPRLPPVPTGRLVVVGAGKAAAAMALATARHYGERASGVVVTRHGYGLRPGETAGAITVLEADHPIPNAAAITAGDRMLDALDDLGDADMVICLLSGGASALMERPAPGIALAEIQRVNRDLLASGAPIFDINVVRKHLSAIKGGRLAMAAWPARVWTFAISDVPGNDPSTIASGPTVADPTTCADALSVLRRYAIPTSRAGEDGLKSGRLETPKPGDPRLDRSVFRLVATPGSAVIRASEAAKEGGWRVVDLGAAVEGEAIEIALRHADIALDLAARGERAVILSGGELTVTHDGSGSGGPNREYALALAVALQGRSGVWALAADTDGIDGAPDAAGAIATPDTLERARAAGLDADKALRRHDSGPFFQALGDDIVTGPTRTNVADFRAIVVEGALP